ncbi:MAG: NfeD family protein [Nevskiaceae bacterium]|nr:MAG: NfeD family protein [Nevskiaceae bacterium]
MAEQLLYWHWWVAGLGLLILEAFMPGAIFLWMGISAFAVGLLAWLMPMDWQVQALLFGVLSIVSFFLYRRFKPAPVSDRPTLNRRGESYVGRVFTLHEPIVNGVGKLHVDDSQWRITGRDAPAGSQVRVVAIDGTTLQVEQTH